MKLYRLMTGIHPGLQANSIQKFDPIKKFTLHRMTKTKQPGNTSRIFSNSRTFSASYWGFQEKVL